MNGRWLYLKHTPWRKLPTSPWVGFELTTLLLFLIISIYIFWRNLSNNDIKSITIQNVDGLLAATDLWVYYIIGRKRFEVATFVSDICYSQLYVYGIEQHAVSIQALSLSLSLSLCLSSLMLWVRARSMRGVLDATLWDKVLLVACDRSVDFSGYSGFLQQ
jgi:hypothetical protein